MKTIIDREKFEIDYIFDWVIKKQENEKLKEESKEEAKTTDGVLEKSNKLKTDNMNLDILTAEKKK